MQHFDDWVTDPRLTLDALRSDFLADAFLVGSHHRTRGGPVWLPVHGCQPLAA